MHHSKHWNKQAGTYREEIFNVWDNDYYGRLKALVEKHANRKGHAVDFGCGIGHGFPLMAPLFKHLMAFDVSAKCLRQAAERGFANVSVNELDLTDSKAPVPYTDFGVCVNVAITHDIKMNLLIIKNVLRAINKGGSVVFVLPSLESGCLTTWNLVQWHKHDGINIDKIPAADFDNLNLGFEQISHGVSRIENAATKHYSLHELHSLFHQGNYRITTVDKLEYPWRTEFNNAPKWMKDPYPWDWVVEVKRVK